jgi:hypothetical protein
MSLRSIVLVVFCLATWFGIETANAYTQLCPGPDVPGVVGPIHNGSACNLMADGTTIDALFVGFESQDPDKLSLDGVTIFDNVTKELGDSTTLSVSPGRLLVALNDTDSRIGTTTYFSGVAYTNFVNLSTTMRAFGPVYHFAYFRITSEADFDALFGPGGNSGGVMMSNAANAYIMAHGGYSSFLFVGAEDLPWAGTDDWNDMVFALEKVGVPEPPSWAMLLLGLAGLGFTAHRSGKRRGRETV